MNAANYKLDQLGVLEAETIHIIREVVAQMERPALLFSGGKDSVLLTHLAMRAMHPSRLGFPLIHIDTGHNFPEVLQFRDEFVAKYNLNLVIGSVQDAISAGQVRELPNGSRNQSQIPVLLDTIQRGQFDALLGGARRDEDRARAKERVFSFRDEFGQWNPRSQRPELWDLYNGMVHAGESVRVFPLSNWTELDVWMYLERHHIELPPLYFARDTEVFSRDGMLFAVNEFTQPSESDSVSVRSVRYRTVGDATLTAAVESEASTLAEIVEEVGSATITERGATRGDDRASEAAMEDRKVQGYF